MFSIFNRNQKPTTTAAERLAADAPVDADRLASIRAAQLADRVAGQGAAQRHGLNDNPRILRSTHHTDRR